MIHQCPLFYRLQNITWPTPDPDDANSAFDKFNTTFQTLYNESFPTTVKKLKLYYNKYKPWITQGILKSVRHKNKLYKSYLKKKTAESKLIYVKYKNKLTNLIRHS